MRKWRVKGFCSIFANPKPVLTMIFLVAIVCVLSYIVGTSYANANSRMSSLSTTVIETGTVSQPTSSEPVMKAELKDAGPNNPAHDPLITSEGMTKRDIKRLGNSEDEDSGEWQTIRMRVTSYCPCRKCCGRYSDGVTASGHKIRPGDSFISADKKYPFGTEMIIAGYNGGQPVKVLDRGGVIRDNRLDVFFDSHEEALEWGVRNLDVKLRRK